MRRIVTLCTALLVWVTSAPSSYATPEHMIWPEYKTDAVEYFQSQLPSPIVIYVYTSSGKLVSIISTHGHNDKPSIQKIGNAIIKQDFQDINESRRVKIAKSLKDFLLDQGYKHDQLIDKRAKFTLLLTWFAVRKSDCARYGQIHREYEDVIRDAIHARQVQGPEYSVAVLTLQSPLVRLECKK